MEKLPEKWCVKSSDEADITLKKWRGGSYGSRPAYLCSEKYWISEQKKLKDEYVEISFEDFKLHILNEKIKLEQFKNYVLVNPDSGFNYIFKYDIYTGSKDIRTVIMLEYNTKDNLIGNYHINEILAVNNTDIIREATFDETDWLEECRKANKFVPFEKDKVKRSTQSIRKIEKTDKEFNNNYPIF